MEKLRSESALYTKIAWLLCWLPALSILPRFLFGVDLTDESYYSALPVSFIHGSQPFVGELSIHTSYGLLVSPFLRLFQIFSPQFAGVVLYMRFLYILFAGLTGWVLYGYFRKLSPILATVVATIPYLLVPFAVGALSYNTMAAFLYTSGMILSLSESNLKKFVGGFFVAAATFCYPSLVPAVLLFVVCTIVLRKRLGIELSFHRGFAMFSVLSGAYLLSFGMENIFGWIQKSLQLWSSALGNKTPDSRIYSLFDDFQKLVMETYLSKVSLILVAMILGVGWLFRNKFKLDLRKFMNFWATGLLVFVVFENSNLTYFTTIEYLTSAVLLIFPFLIVTTWVKLTLIEILIIGASYLALFFCQLKGTHGLYATVVAGLPICFITIRRHFEYSVAVVKRLLIMGGLVICCWLSVVNWLVVYRDVSPNLANHILSHGPFMGIRTSAARGEYLDLVQGLLDQIPAESKSIMFSEAFPVGYLLTNLRPQTPLIWLPEPQYYSNLDRTVFRKFFADGNMHKPDVFIQILKPNEPPFASTSVIAPAGVEPARYFGQGSYQLYRSNEIAEIWLRNSKD